jgi:hypothetical protein
MNPSLGDLIFTRWAGLSSRLTQWVTSGKAAHVEQICDDGPTPKVSTASKALNAIKVWTWHTRKSYFASTKTAWCRYSLKRPLTRAERDSLLEYFEEAGNTFSYSSSELLLQGLDALKNWVTRTPYDDPKAVWFRRAGNWAKSAVICSKHSATGLIRLGLLPAHAEFWSPADLLRYVSKSQEWIFEESVDGFFEIGEEPTRTVAVPWVPA